MMSAVNGLSAMRAQCECTFQVGEIVAVKIVYLERRVESLAVCMPQLNNTCANLYAKNAQRRATTHSVCMGYYSLNVIVCYLK